MASRALYQLGFLLRETGQALDRLGLRVQGSNAYKEQLSRHRTVMNLFNKKPVLGGDVFIAPNAALIGDVEVGSNVSVWYGAVLRGDVNKIKIGSLTNIQDRTVVHVAKIGGDFPTIIGDKVTIGHGAIIHACTIEDESLIGMGAVILDGAVVEKNSILAAGAVLGRGKRIPAGQVWAGNPAKFIRAVTADEVAFFTKSAEDYAQLAGEHAAEWAKTFEQLEAEKAARKAAAERDEDYDNTLIKS